MDSKKARSGWKNPAVGALAKVALRKVFWEYSLVITENNSHFCGCGNLYPNFRHFYYRSCKSTRQTKTPIRQSGLLKHVYSCRSGIFSRNLLFTYEAFRCQVVSTQLCRVLAGIANSEHQMQLIFKSAVAFWIVAPPIFASSLEALSLSKCFLFPAITNFLCASVLGFLA